MKREVFFLVGADDTVLWSDASDSALALPDSRARWEAIWSRRAEVVELAHSHPVGPDAFSLEDVTTMEALDVALGKRLSFSLVTPKSYLVRGAASAAIASERQPRWVDSLRAASGLVPFPRALVAPADALVRWAASPPADTRRLAPLVEAIKAHGALTFVCTHNARRSQLAQVIAWAAARWHGLAQHHFFSAGTEATRVDQRAFDALARMGFGVEGAQVRVSSAEAPYVLTSKTLSDETLPKAFAAVMVCSSADAACPFVRGASARVSLPYDDPGVTGDFEGCVELIGRDLTWAFARAAA